jgi:acetate kinase
LRLLVVNAGSSSLKLRLLDARDDVAEARDVELSPGAPIPGDAFDGLSGVDAIGHRVVHGGDADAATWIDAEVRERLERLTELAPLHQPLALAGIDAAARAFSGVPAAACFDTAFHATLPAAAATYALPAAWRERWPVRRYGFHGLSHAYAARRAAELVGRPVEDLRIVTCHLGAGASLAAVGGGRSVETTMGFTPLEGIVMATRSGSVDPGLLLWLLDQGLTPDELTDGLQHHSGLAGLAGTGDMREVLANAAGDDAARLALDVYAHRLRGGVAAMAAALDGLDVLVFTGGVGEHQPPVRSAAVAGLGFLGLRLDEEVNRTADGDTDLTAAGAKTSTLLVAAREDQEIAHQTRARLGR